MFVEILYDRTLLDDAAMLEMYREFHILGREAYMKQILNLSCLHPSYDGVMVCLGASILCEADDENASGQPRKPWRIPLAQHDCMKRW